MASSPTTLSEALDYLRKLINIHGNTKITINDHKDNFQKIITIVEDATSTSSDKSEENERLCSLFDQQQKELEKSIEENEQLKDLSNQQQKEIVNLKDEIIRVKAQNYDKIIGKAVNSIGTVQTSKSYSDMVKANISEQINSTRRSNHVVIISPKEDSISKDSNQTVAIAKEKINIKTTIDNGLRIEKFQPASSRKCIIKCNSEKDVEKICCILKDDDMILAKKPVKKNPRIMIVGISKDISRKEIVAFIIAQNPNVASLLEQDKKEFMKIIFDKEDRVGTKFAILETSPKLWKMIIDGKYLFIGHKSCHVKNRISVLQCYNCYRFGHNADNCENPTTCANCSGNHKTEDCKSSSYKCCNCERAKTTNNKNNASSDIVNTTHRAFNVRCPQFQKEIASATKYYHYG